MQLFYLERFEDVHGQSGVGIVAEGCAFSDGTAVLRWLVAPESTVVREMRDGVSGLQQFQAVHGHGGRTRVRLGVPTEGKRRYWNGREKEARREERRSQEAAERQVGRREARQEARQAARRGARKAEADGQDRTA